MYFVLLVARERPCRGGLGTCGVGRIRGAREGGKFLLANAEGCALRFEPVAVVWKENIPDQEPLFALKYAQYCITIARCEILHARSQ